MLIQQTTDRSSHRLAACGTRGTKEPYIKTAVVNMTGLLWLAWAAAFNLLGLTVMLPTPITFTNQIAPKGRYGKVSNLVHHGQRIHNGLYSLPARPACAVLLPRQHHAQGLISAVLAAKQYPKCGAGLEGYQCLLQHNPSSA